MNTILDIETTGRPADELAEFEPEFNAPGNYVKPEAIAKYIDEARAEWQEKAALKAITGRLLLVTTLTQDVEFYTGTEGELIGAVWDEWAKGGRIIGFNIKDFDLPWLCQKSWMLGIPVPLDLRKGRYWADRIVDLLEVWCCYTNNYRGQNLDAVCRACGFGGKLADGKDFGAMWESNRQLALDYAGHEAELQWKLAERLGVIGQTAF